MQNETQNEKVRRQRIERKKRFGIKKNITEYEKLLYSTFYDEEMLEETLNDFLKTVGQETLNDAFSKYLKKVSEKTKKLLDDAKELLMDSWKKGTKRVLDEEGNTVKVDATIDEKAVELLSKQQQEHYQSLTKQQSKIVDNLIASGLREGKDYKKIVEDIQDRVKKTTKHSATRIARTEIVKTHNIGQIQTMQDANIEFYSFINSPNYIGKDGKKYPCIICRKLQGSKGREYIYEVSKAGDSNNPLPVLHSHPNCNCTCVARTDK